MPELAEVDYYRKQWDVGLNQRIIDVAVHPKARIFRGERPAPFAKMLAGKTYRASYAHGKNMLFEFSGGIWIGGHLGMTGSICTRPAGAKPEKHDHLSLRQKGQSLAFNDPRMFGRIRFHEGKEPPQWWQDLPIEVLAKKYTFAHLQKFLNRRKKAPIKAVLLEQDAFPGIGNWMADEVLWRAKLPPSAPISSLSEADRRVIWKEVRTVARQAMRVIAPDWGDPPDSWLFNHRWRDGGNCPRCKGALIRESLRGRTTCWCVTCQER